MPTQIVLGQTFIGIGFWNKMEQQSELLTEEFYGPDVNHPENCRIDEAAFTPYWPGRSGLYADAQPLLVAPPSHLNPGLVSGSLGSLGFSGVTRDANNSPIGKMTMRLFRTSDSALVGTAVSRYDGSYNMSTPYAGEDHFLVCHKSGSPEVAGASQSTLQPW